MSRPYTTDDKVRNYIDSKGITDIGTDIIGTAAIAEKIVHADNIIDMECAKRYSVPFVTTPPAIETISTVMTSWFSLRSIFTGEVPSAIDFVEDDYKKAMEWLGSIKNQEIDLPAGTVTSGSVIAEKGQSGQYWSSKSDYTPIFDVDDELNQSIDSDLLSDIADGRE